MKILIIGSKGFIGSQLTNYLKSKNYEIWSADIIDYEGVNYPLDPSAPDYRKIFKSAEFNLCINCSGAANVPESIVNPEKDFILNTVNVFRMLSAIKEFQPECRFLNLSSAAVYGNPRRLPITERFPVGPISPYGIHKLQSEQICQEFYSFYKIRTCSLRIFSVYGKGLKKQIFWDLYQKVNKNEPIKLLGNGNESRDFINIHDLTRAIEIIFNAIDFKADIINVANGIEVKIHQAATIFFSLFDQSISYSFTGTARSGDPVNWRADISKLENLGYKPEVDLYHGLKEYYYWLKNCTKYTITNNN